MKLKFLLITANVGSLFEEGCLIHEHWFDTLLTKILSCNANFIGIHLQEVGGKSYEQCTVQVLPMIKKITKKLNDYGYSIGFGYLDTDFAAIEQYTALGALFFFTHSILPHVRQFDFDSSEFVEINENSEFLEATDALCKLSSRIRKKKFPRHFWSDTKWGRKGYLYCRFRFLNRPIDIVNVHLFHDDSNIAFIQKDPQIYSENRKRALEFVLDEIQFYQGGDNSSTYPLFIFGDLNFRLSYPSFLNKITKDANIRRESVVACNEMESHPDTPSESCLNSATGYNQRGVSAVEFRMKFDEAESQEECLLRIERKRFDYANEEDLLSDWHRYLEDDIEIRKFPMLHELPIDFPPTYPWSEDPSKSEKFLKTRAPAWCDRVLMNSNAKQIVSADINTEYNSIGKDSCMGDHKPVLLSFIMDFEATEESRVQVWNS